MQTNKGHPLIILIALVLTLLVLASFTVWWISDVSIRSNLFRGIFLFSVVVSNVFLLLTRVFHEWSGYR